MVETTKVCKECGLVKPTTEYYKRKNAPDGLFNTCKLCEHLKDVTYGRTLKGYLTAVYKDQKSHSKSRDHLPPTYTKQELKDWLLYQPNFKDLWDAWVLSDYDRWAKPSVDRKDESIGYTLNNIQLMSWRENNEKSHIAKSNFEYPGCKAVIQYDMSGNKLAEFKALTLAARSTKIPITTIHGAMNGRVSHAGGFLWEYADAN